MEITNEKPVEKFTVAIGLDFGLGDRRIEAIVLQLAGTKVRLNKEECQELLNVMDGKCHRIAAYRNKEEYQAHSAILCSTHGKKGGELTIFTEDSIAKC